LNPEQIAVRTEGTVLTPEGPLAAGPVLAAGEGVGEFAFSSGVVSYESRPTSEPPVTTAAVNQLHLRLGISTGGIGDFNVIGTVSPLSQGRSIGPRLQQSDVDEEGVLGAFTALQRFDFVPDSNVSAGLTAGFGARSAAFVRTIDGVESRGRRATWFFHGGVHGGGNVAGPLWLGASIAFENLAMPTGERTAFASSASDADQIVRRFRHVAVFTPSLDLELRFGSMAIAGSAYSSVASERRVAALPFGARLGMRFYFGGAGGELPPEKPASAE
jgi:hypothetical protein